MDSWEPRGRLEHIGHSERQGQKHQMNRRDAEDTEVDLRVLGVSAVRWFLRELAPR